MLLIRPVDPNQQHRLSPPIISEVSMRGSATASYGAALTVRLPIGGLKPRRSRGEVVCLRRSSRKELLTFSPGVAHLMNS